MTTSTFPDEYDDFGPAPVPSVPGTPGTLLSGGHLDAHELLADAAAKMQRAIGKPGESDPASIEKRIADVIDTSAAAAADATSAQAAAAAAELGVTALVAALGTAAYTAAADYATAAQGATADATASAVSLLESNLGTSAFLDTGTSAGNVVVLGVGGALPPVSGAALLDLPAGGVTDYADLTGKPTLGTAAATAATDYAVAAEGVTNGDAHDHNGGDGAQIAYASLSGTPTLGSAAAAATGDFEPAGAVSTHAGLAAPHSGHSTPASVSAAISSHNSTSGVHGISAFMATVLDDADATTARTTLGVPAGSGTSTGANSGDASTPAETVNTIGAMINGATSKTTPVDADKFSIWDSVSGLLQAVTWANIKTTLASVFVSFTGSTSPVSLGGTLTLSSGGNYRVAPTTNELLAIDYSETAAQFAFFPGAGFIWHDRLAFGRGYGFPTFEVYNGAWVSGTLDKGLFAKLENREVQQIDGVTNTACRWTWHHANVAYSRPAWWMLGVTFASSGLTKDIRIESSSNGSTWTTRHLTAGNTDHAKVLLLSCDDYGGDNYVRLTITVTNGQPLKMSSIRALSARWGNQGGGSEQEFAVLWDAEARVAFGANNSNLSPSSSAGVTMSGPGYGAPASSGEVQTFGIWRAQQGGSFTVLDCGTTSSYSWLQATRKTDLSTNYNLALNPNGGNVGVGTNSPSAKLHVAGDFRQGFDASNYEASTISSVGKTTKTLVGTTPSIAWTVSDATTNTIYDVATFSKNCTGAGAIGLGVRINLAAKSSTTADTVFGAISASVVEATHATRKGKVRLFGADSTGLREGFCAEADGTQIKTSVNGVAAVARAAALTAEIPGDATRDELRLTELYNACKAFGIIN